MDKLKTSEQWIIASVDYVETIEENGDIISRPTILYLIGTEEQYHAYEVGVWGKFIEEQSCHDING
jgi:uncharacterized protein Yka (UPF0111/DUF47 family)